MGRERGIYELAPNVKIKNHSFEWLTYQEAPDKGVYDEYSDLD